MRVSLNDIVQMLSDRLGQPFNVPLQEELKIIVNYKRADWIQKLIDKHPEQRKYFLKDFTAALVEADKAECPVNLDCKVLRTEFKVPVPVRTDFALFDYVGDPDKADAYAYTTPDQLYWILVYGAKYTRLKPRYLYINGYIYIYNEEILEYINVRGMWPDQRELHDFKCGEEPCYTDDDKYDIPDDLLNTMIQDILKNELRILLSPEQAEVTVTQDQPQ
jgi:hypothetical protein